VISGGPAGSATATLLAEKGDWVTQPKKAHHPRFHIKEFSWFICRVTHSTMRKLFMLPRNDFRVREALLSVLAFKAVYYLASLANLKRTVTAWQRRKINIRPQEEAGCR
jgi:hypothetical protein